MVTRSQKPNRLLFSLRQTLFLNESSGFFLNNSNVCLNWTLSFSVSLQVDIVPSQGEISVGESKFFLCQGKCPRPTTFQEAHRQS